MHSFVGLKGAQCPCIIGRGAGGAGGIFVLTAGEFAFQEDGGAEII